MRTLSIVEDYVVVRPTANINAFYCTLYTVVDEYASLMQYKRDKLMARVWSDCADHIHHYHVLDLEKQLKRILKKHATLKYGIFYARIFEILGLIESPCTLMYMWEDLVGPYLLPAIETKELGTEMRRQLLAFQDKLYDVRERLTDGQYKELVEDLGRLYKTLPALPSDPLGG